MAINAKVTQEPTNYEVKVTRVKAFDKGGVRFDILVNGINIYNMGVAEKDGEQFFTFPNRKDSKTGKYYSHCWFKISPELQAEIEAQINALL